jgi:hypothetical protein
LVRDDDARLSYSSLIPLLNMRVQIWMPAPRDPTTPLLFLSNESSNHDAREVSRRRVRERISQQIS